jgi:DNA repair exonuclease SbcCD ATPase subunit
MFTEFEKRQPSIEATIALVQVNIKDLNAYISRYRDLKVQDDTYNTAIIKHQFLSRAIDYTLGSDLLDANSISSEITSLEASVKSIEASIAKTRADNKLVEAHNTKVALISEQQLDMQKELGTYTLQQLIKSKELAELQVLVKSFSPTGLIAYKIECLVKDLEGLTNEYLGTMSDGRFQLSFKIESADKLNVIITDNGDDIDILALSTGERARVNISTLLAIRKLMQALSNSRTNLLFLDETIANLDSEGKELLIEVLLAEESLNTFLVSHDYSHPLLEKLNVVKENNISRIE